MSGMMEFRPFQDSLRSETTLVLAHRYYQSHPPMTDSEFLSLLLIIDSNMKSSFTNSPPDFQGLRESIIEIQSLISSASSSDSSSISDHLVCLARQRFLSNCADLITLQSGYSTISRVLHVLSFHSAVAFDEDDLSAFSALMTLRSVAHLAASHDSEFATLWNDPELGSILCEAVVPEDGSIRRLHSRLFCDARAAATHMIPEWGQEDTVATAKKFAPFLHSAEVLRDLVSVVSVARRQCWQDIELAPVDLFSVLFVLVGRLPSAPPLGRLLLDCTPASLSSVDVELLLVQLSVWCSQYNQVVGQSHLGLGISCRLPLNVEQIRTWQAVANFISGRRNDPSTMLRVGRVVDSARLQHQTPNLKIIYSTFKFMEKNDFPVEWLDLYARKIDTIISECEMLSSSSLLPLPTTGDTDSLFPSVDEEERMWEHANRYISKRLISLGQFVDAEQRLVKASGLESTTLLLELYRKWLPTASTPDQKAYVEQRVKEAEEMIRSVDPYSPLLLTTPSPRKQARARSPPILLPVEDEVPVDVGGSFPPTTFALPPVSPAPEVPSPTKPIQGVADQFYSPLRKNFADAGTNTAGQPGNVSLLEASFHSLDSPTTGMRTSFGGNSTDDNSFSSALGSPYKSGVDGADLFPGDNDRTPTRDTEKSSPRSLVSPPEEPQCPIPRPQYQPDSPADLSSRSLDISNSSANSAAQQKQQQEEEAEMESFLCEFITAKISTNKRRLDNAISHIKGSSPARTPLRGGVVVDDSFCAVDFQDSDEVARLRDQLAEAERRNRQRILQERLESSLIASPAAGVFNHVTVRSAASRLPSKLLDENDISSLHSREGYCIGCQSDDVQDRALRDLDKMAFAWNLTD